MGQLDCPLIKIINANLFGLSGLGAGLGQLDCTFIKIINAILRRAIFEVSDGAANRRIPDLAQKSRVPS